MGGRYDLGAAGQNSRRGDGGIELRSHVGEARSRSTPFELVNVIKQSNVNPERSERSEQQCAVALVGQRACRPPTPPG